MKTVWFPNTYKTRFILMLCVLSFIWQSNAQCPTVTTSTQNFCDIESILIGDLAATNNGNGVVWYDTATSTEPLNPTDGLVNGEDYYADDRSGSCETRQRVVVVITGPPIGQNFQGICLDDPNEAKISDLTATGNDVQWYLQATGGTPLSQDTGLIDDRIYYADQANPVTGCRGSRLSVLVNVGNIPIPTGDAVQEFCYVDERPTVADLVASGQNNWYASISSAAILDPTTPLVNGASYYATTVDPPCESNERLRVIARLESINPGLDNDLEICENDAPIDLFSVLGGSPTAGGTWSPTLTSGTGVFDPAVDRARTYTYAISGAICNEVTSQVRVIIDEEPDAGESVNLQLCEDDTSPINLFNALNGTPDPGGQWSPALSSGNNVFNPNVDAPGDYTYSVDGGSCGIATALVRISIEEVPNAGTGTTVDLCATETDPIDLFTFLGDNPDSGGTWSPALASGTGVFDPLTDPQGMYTYSLSGNGICPDSEATITVTISPEPNAGSGGSLTICSNEITTIDLFTLLTGTPDSGGFWSPALSSGTGIFDPAVDSEGVYTYLVSGNGICPDASSMVEIIIETEPNAGTGANLNLCPAETDPVDLFSLLEGAPDTGGTWTPALNSGTGVFDPNSDAPGAYTYTIIGNGTCPDASASIVVTIESQPNAGMGSSISICENDTMPIDLFGLLGGTPDTGGRWSPVLASGTGVFDPSVDSAGNYTYIVEASDTCPEASATVVVDIIPRPNAGVSNSLSICDIDTSTIDLFSLLGGSPESGGTWSPALASGTGIFDPSVDTAGTYTYTIEGTAECPALSASADITVLEAPNAGSDAALSICEGDTTQVDLFNLLGTTADTGGTWSPALNSGTGVFDPTVDAEGTYTYTITSTNACPDASAKVEVAFLPQLNAGMDGSLDICETDSNTFDLFSALTGTPDAGGTWTPSLASGTGVFDPSVDMPGTYTYSFAGSAGCPDVSANVLVTLVRQPEAGTDGSIELCVNDTNTIDLFTLLGGTPDTGGQWIPALASGTGIFDPSIDQPGVYTYELTNPPCPTVSAQVSVSFAPTPNAGTDGTINLCNNNGGTVNLLDFLGPDVDAGGTWIPALISGTSIFDLENDRPGAYTYRVGPDACGITDNSKVTIVVFQAPDVTGLVISEDTTICLSNEVTVNISDAVNLADGDYIVNYQLSGANTASGFTIASIIRGSGSFTIAADDLTEVGVSTLSLIGFYFPDGSCSADLSSVNTIQITVEDTPPPTLISDGEVFCLADEATILSLSERINEENDITWYDAPSEGNEISNDTALADLSTYYASQVGENGCESTVRLAVTVSIMDCIDELIIPDGFSPNGDGVNDDFHIVNLNDLYPNFRLKIFNRYGNILYEGDRQTPRWNGTSNRGNTLSDNTLPTGVYFYILDFNDGERKSKQGRVYLNR